MGKRKNNFAAFARLVNRKGESKQNSSSEFQLTNAHDYRTNCSLYLEIYDDIKSLVRCPEMHKKYSFDFGIEDACSSLPDVRRL